MESGFQTQTPGLVDFGPFMAKNTESYWEFPTLDSKSVELVKKPAGFGKKNKSQNKNSAASKSHCEAERRRRERINGHLATLRDFLPCSDKIKMDKATLLAEVITHLKLLKKQAIEASKGLLVPTDTDEVTVDPYYDDPIEDGYLAFKVSICCQYKPQLIPEIRQAINDLKLTITKAEISTLEGRMKSVLVITGCEIQDGFAKLIQKALCCVLEKISKSDEFSSMIVMNKRRRVAYTEPSTSSSS